MKRSPTAAVRVLPESASLSSVREGPAAQEQKTTAIRQDIKKLNTIFMISFLYVSVKSKASPVM